MTGRAPPLNKQTPTQLLVIAFYIPLFPGVPLLASFFATPKAPEWAVWIARAALAGFLAAAWCYVTLPRLREVRRRKSAAPDAGPDAAADGGG